MLTLTAGALVMASLNMASLNMASLNTAYTSPEDRYRLALSVTEDRQDQARQKYAVRRTTEYVTAVNRSRIRTSPKVDLTPPPVDVPPAVTEVTATDEGEPPTVRAGDSPDMVWVKGVLARYGLPMVGEWSVDGSGRCATLASGKWAGCTTMSSPPVVKIAPMVIGTEYGVFTVVHEWVHAAENNRDECATQERANDITGRTERRGYDC